MLKPIKIGFPCPNMDGKTSITYKPRIFGECSVVWESGDSNYLPLSIVRRSAGDNATMRYSRQKLKGYFIPACKIT